MSDEREDLIPLFIPALAAILLAAEDKKSEPLTVEEVLRIRDKTPCIMMKRADAARMAESRGRDIDPENCWYEWQLLRRELGRKPDLDPGPKFASLQSSDPAYQQTIRDAQATLDDFRRRLPTDGACLKTEIRDDGRRSFMWLNQVRRNGSDFIAEFFEVPEGSRTYRVGDSLEIAADAVLDWSVNDDGVLYGGFSLRYQRAQMPENERAEFDDYIGVTKYA